LFNEAMGLPTPEARAVFLREACAGDDQLRQRVEALLQAAQPTNDFLEQAAPGARTFLSASPGAAASPSPPPEERAGERRATTPTPPGATVTISLNSLPVSEKPGDRIGHYKLLEQIGEGGCGVVYMAQQTEPIRRQVAFKVIKLGMDTKSVVARFEAERQALALMDHPNIAKVLDAGATETGRPYFVMELVKGIKITDYCDQNHLDTKERLDLFIQVCHAIQHAHQKGIIHRDIKPSNVLVCSHDGVPVPKVIDFGIAKATQQPLTDKTVFTAFGQFIGTPAYMSPEQAELSGLDIDTRTDIYALGVLLYELLTGKPPFEPETLMKVGLDEMRRIIRETEPPKPSTKLATTPHSALRTPQSTAPHWKDVRGDLDWIVMKCLEKNRARRYPTADSLADDLGHHLNNEPVEAGAPGAMYRMGKFVRRHRYGFATASAIILLLIAGVVVSTWQMARATRAEKQARTVASFLEDMLNSVRPEEARGQDTKLLREILDKAAARVAKELQGQPEVAGELQSTIGGVYQTLGRYGEAEAMYRGALANRRKFFGREHRKVAVSLADLGFLHRLQGKNSDAEAVFREALAMQRKLLGDKHPDVTRSLANLSIELWRQGKAAEAETLSREALANRKNLFGSERTDIATLVGQLVWVPSEQGRLKEVEAIYREAIAMSKHVLGNENSEVAALLRGFALALKGQGRLAEAETIFREALTMQKKSLSNEHPEVAMSLEWLARVLATEGKLGEAEAAYQEALAMRKKLQGPDHPLIANLLNNFGGVLADQKKFNDAENMYREALAMGRRLFPSDHPTIANQLNSLGGLLLQQRKLAEAEVLRREALGMWRRLLGNENQDVARSLNNLAVGLDLQGKYAEAEALHREALAMRRKLLRRDHPDIVLSLDQLAGVLARQRKVAEAERTTLERWYVELGIAQLCQDPPSLDKALEVVGGAIEKKPQDYGCMAVRAAIYGRQAKWQAAATDLSRSVKLASSLSRNLPAFALGPLLVETGDTIGYDNRRRMVSVTSWGEDPETAAEAAMEMSLLPRDGGWTAPAQLAATAVTHGTNHIRLPYFQLVKGLVEYRQGRFDSAVEWAQKSLAGSGTNYTIAASAGAVLAMAQQQLKQPDEARKSLAQATQVFETKLPKLESGDLGENWPEWLIARILLREATSLLRGEIGAVDGVRKQAQGLANAGKLAEREAMFREALALLRKVGRGEDVAVARTLSSLGTVLRAEGKYAEAEKTYRECLRIHEKVHPNDWDVFQSRFFVGAILMDQKKHKEAEPLMLDGCQGMMERVQEVADPGGRISLLQQTIPILVQLYDETGRPEQAAEWRKKLADLEKSQPPAKRVSPENITTIQTQRGNLSARKKHYKEAAGDFSKLAEAHPDNHLFYHLLAPALVAAGDAEGYRRCCQKVIAQFGETTNPTVAERMAKACLILPSSGADMAIVSKMAEVAIRADTNHSLLPYFQFSKGLAEYRQDRFASAAEWLRKALDSKRSRDDYRDVQAYMVLAMSQYQLKQVGEARKTLATGTDLASQKLPKADSGDLGPAWNDWIIAETLMREAKGIVEAK